MSARPEIFDKEAVIESLSAFTPSRKVAEDTTSAMSLLFPLIIAEIGTEKLSEIVEQKLTEFGYAASTVEVWKSNRIRYIVEWAQHEIEQFRKRKQG